MKKILVFALLFVLTAIPPALAVPSAPTGLELSSTSTTIDVTWNASSQDIDGYEVSYQEADNATAYEVTVDIDDPTAASYTITGLTPDTEYDVYLSAYDEDGNSTRNSKSITTDDLKPGITLVDAGTIEIDVSAYNDTVDTYDVQVGTSSGASDQYSQSGIDVEEKTRVPGLSDGTYYILVNVVYNSGNNGSSGEIQFDVGDYGTFFSQSGDIDNGCFIQQSSGQGLNPWLIGTLIACVLFFLSGFRKSRLPLCSLFIVLMVYPSSARCQKHEDVNYNNLIGIKGGYFVPSESLLDDTYDSIIPVSLYYERMFGRYFSMDFSAGYCRTSGNAVTASGDKTGVDTELDFIPLSASMNLNVPVTNLVTCYLGAGGDYWSFEEDFNKSKNKTEVGGYHGKLGLKLFTEDSDYFKRGAVLIEASYSVLDRFGNNDADLGGWTYSLGVMYCF